MHPGVSYLPSPCPTFQTCKMKMVLMTIYVTYFRDDDQISSYLVKMLHRLSGLMCVRNPRLTIK